MKSANVIFIRDLRLQMNIGIFEQEKKGPQPVLVNAEIRLDDALVWEKDDITETVAYDDLVNLIEKISREKHYELIETFLEIVAANILKISQARSVELSAEKPGIIKSAGGVGVRIIRKKS